MNNARATLCACFLLALVHCGTVTASSNTTVATSPSASSITTPTTTSNGGAQGPQNTVTQASGSSVTPAPVAVKGNCTSAKCETGLLCEKNVCKATNGTVCSHNDECQSGTECASSPNTCQPKLGFFGGACNSSSCHDSSMECTSASGKCACKTGYELKVEDFTCKIKSGSAAVLGSILVMAVAFLTTRLA